MRLVIPFTASQPPELSEVGGKGLSLIRMTERGLPVPPGFVLTRAFFEPWLEAVRQSSQWHEVLSASPEALPLRVAEVQAQYGSFELDDARYQALAAALQDLEGSQHTKLYAVRSSSPEEDLEGASFAGGYETVLGITSDCLQEAIWRCAASCLTERVLLYKRQHGFDAQRPSIAVIVQQQIAADKAGVAFSLNPVNNCYDEAVINANFGLGETVVSGRVSPDQFVVDKVSLRILERKLGSKEVVVVLRPDGGTQEQPDAQRERFCLADSEVLTLTRMLIDVETYFGKPIDIEWALADGEFHVLQARPITAYFPLPPAAQTRPGEPKRLYLDGTLTKLGMNVPLSPLGVDFLDTFGDALLRHAVRTDLYNLEDGFYFSANGHNYVNLSNALRVGGKHKAQQMCRTMDVVCADIIRDLDEREYRAPKFPAALKRLGLLRALVVVPQMLWNTFRAIRSPDACQERFAAGTVSMEKELAAEIERAETLLETTLRGTRTFARFFFAQELPVVFAAQRARSSIDRIFRHADSEVRRRVGLLEQAVPHNCTIEMGLAMFRLSQFPEVREVSSADEFAARLKAHSFSPEFRAAWDAYMSPYGHRCPGELDPATPRYSERPGPFCAQLLAMAKNTDEATNPLTVFERGRTEREQSYAILLQEARKIGPRAVRSFAANYRVLVALKGYRELPKFHIVLMAALFRKRALAAARVLCEAGRLDRPEDLFQLTMGQIDAALPDGSVDLRDALRRAAQALQGRSFRNYPRLIDSRGRILRPRPKPAAEGVFAGEPISPGIARGKVKVLNDPEEKPLLPGEILVARATDPGWTPLFLNAAGILLEVGGLLQHGAVVAREYCKPCVAGLEDVTERLQDGQLVEVDGTNGTVRLIA